MGAVDHSSNYRQITLQITLGTGSRRGSLFTRIVRSGRRHDHLVATHAVRVDLPVESLRDCLDVLSEALRVLQEHPGIDWASGPPAPPPGDMGGL